MTPKNSMDSKMDAAITGGNIFRVASNIPANTAKKVVDVSGLYITPGIICFQSPSQLSRIE